MTLTALALIAVVCETAQGEAPKGWFRAGSQPKLYEMSLDRTVTHGGAGSATLKSIATRINGFGTLMQTFDATSFRGKRIRMTGHVRASEVEEWAGLWLRVDGPKSEALAFDNMQERAVKGTRDWEKHEIVLDVPATAQQIAFGLLLTGKGQVWMDDLTFEEVGLDVATTGAAPVQRTPSLPKNLDFEEQ